MIGGCLAFTFLVLNLVLLKGRVGWRSCYSCLLKGFTAACFATPTVFLLRYLASFGVLGYFESGKVDFRPYKSVDRLIFVVFDCFGDGAHVTTMLVLISIFISF